MDLEPCSQCYLSYVTTNKLTEQRRALIFTVVILDSETMIKISFFSLK
jgi:hypothetical protein